MEENLQSPSCFQKRMLSRMHDHQPLEVLDGAKPLALNGMCIQIQEICNTTKISKHMN